MCHPSNTFRGIPYGAILHLYLHRSEGKHNYKRSSYGHSIVIDPNGQIIAERSESGPGLLMAHIPAPDNSMVPRLIGENMLESRVDAHFEDPVDQIRRQLPVAHHRRFDLFPQ
ncbi:unnamed protein product, partial [Protopolystoma xenopodis]